jgi:hypothetical protein
MFPVKRGASSQSIPIANIRASPSELQLHEDEALAEFREYRMYNRIVTGMKVKSLDSNHTSATESLENIILAGNNPRFAPVQQWHPHGHLEIVTPDMQMAYDSSYATTASYRYNHIMMPLLAAEASNHDHEDFFEDDGIFELEL